MKLVVFQVKGGVSKTSIAINMALTHSMYFITNDLVTDLKKFSSLETYKLEENLKKIPARVMRKDRDIIFDMGAMSGNIDPKIAHTIKLADGIIIPTLTDQRSIDGAIESINFAKEECNNIFVIVNRVTKEDDYLYAVDQLKDHIDESSIFMMKETTLFKRISRDGDKWYNNVHHEKGSYMLKRTIQNHNEIYKEIYNTTFQLKTLKEKLS